MSRRGRLRHLRPVHHRVDLDVRGRLITLRLGPNSRVTNANVYEHRWRYSYPADGQQAQLSRPTNTATPGTLDQWQKHALLYRLRVALMVVRVFRIYFISRLTHPFSREVVR